MISTAIGTDDGNERARKQALSQIADALGKLGHPASVPEEIAELRRAVDSLRDRIDRGDHHYGCCGCHRHGYFHYYYPYTYTSVAAGGYVGNTYTIAAGGASTTYPASTTTVTYPTVTTTSLTTWNTGAGGSGGLTAGGGNRIV